MKNILLETAFCLLAGIAAATNGNAAIGSWRAYMAYSEIQQIKEAGNVLFVRASNSLYQYNTTDQSITTYDKTTGMSDTYITRIDWNKTARKLIVIYDNSNIDLVDIAGNITNISDLYSSTMTEDKTVNSTTNSGEFTYLATNFGVVKVNMAREEISETYNLGLQVARVGLNGGNIYVSTQSGDVWMASENTNLIDKSKWAQTTSYPDNIFVDDDSDTENNRELVSSLSPGGPSYNYFGYLRVHNGKLYAANGYSDLTFTAALQVYDGTDWTLYENDIEDQIGHPFVNLFCCDIDPTDESHVFAGGRTGLYEYRNSRFVREYTNDNSPLETAETVGGDNKNYVLVTSVEFDRQGNLWVANSTSPSTSILKLNRDGSWESHHHDELMVSYNNRRYALEHMEDMMFDSRGLMWMNNNYWNMPALIRYDTSNDDITVYSDFENQDGTSLTMSFVNSVVEDRDGNIWMGTSSGPGYIESTQAASGQLTFIQPKIPRNDGTNYADYLLNNIPISAVAIDGGNRKWLGTSGNGIYLISADNMAQLQHFTTENSPLLSDNIQAIAINNTTGEVFFGTDKGLCSYMSDATAPADEMEKDNVYAYPNPVEPGYTGLITVVGLSFDADVKITTATGYLVAEGRSNGGMFTWDGRDRDGRRVASGVYNIVTAKSDGSKGTVCKVAVVR